MKQIKIILSVLLVVISFITKAQDTIVFKSKVIEQAKIIEVGITEVKYKRFNNINGPTYTSNKNLILYIKYLNGQIDTIHQSPVVANTNFDSQPQIVNNDRIEIYRNTLRYKGVGLNNKKLEILIDNYSRPESREQLKAEFRTLKVYERNIKGLAPGLFLCGFLVPAAGTVYAIGQLYDSGNNGEQAAVVFVSGVVGGAILRIAAHVVNKVNKNKRASKKTEIAKLYNGDM